MTALGENFYNYVQEAEDRAFVVAPVRVAKNLTGPLKLVGVSELLNAVVVPKMKRFSEQYPSVNLELSALYGLNDVSARQADIIVAMVEKPPSFLTGKKVADIHYGVYATRHYLDALRTCHSVVLLNNEHRTPDWLKRHFPGADVALRASDIPTMLSAAKAHMGLARLPCFIADKEQSLVRVDVALNHSSCGIWVLSHIEQVATERVTACKDFLYKHLGDQRFLIEGECSRFAS